MTPKEKAEELILKYLRLQELNSYNWFDKALAIKCSLITIDEMLEVLCVYEDISKDYQYWQQVKKELEKL